MNELTVLQQNEFSGQKMLLVTCDYVAKKWQRQLKELGEQVLLQLVVLPHFAKNNKLFYETVVKQLSDDVGLLVAFGAGNVCDVVKAVASCKQKPYVLVCSACSSGGYALSSYHCYFNNQVIVRQGSLPKCVVLDQEVLANTPNKMVASALGELVGYLVFACDLLFLYPTNSDVAITIHTLEELVLKVLSEPFRVLTTPWGKQELLSALLQCQMVANQTGKMGSVACVNNVLLMLLNQGISYGTGQFISSLTLLKLFQKVFEANALPEYGFLNVERHVALLRNAFTNFPLHFLNCIPTKNNYVLAKLNKVKNLQKQLCGFHFNQTQNALRTFQNLHQDKAVYLHKKVNKQFVLLAMYLATDVYVENNLLCALKHVGLLEFFSSDKLQQKETSVGVQ